MTGIGTSRIADACECGALSALDTPKIFPALDTSKMFEAFDRAALKALDTSTMFEALDTSTMFETFDRAALKGLDTSTMFEALDTSTIFEAFDRAALKAFDTSTMFETFDRAALKGLDTSTMFETFGRGESLAVEALREQEREVAHLAAMYAVAAAYAAVMFFLLWAALYLRYPKAVGLLFDAAGSATWSWLLGTWIYRSLHDRDE